MIRKQVTIYETVQFLNELLAIDQQLVSSLIANRVKCNEGICEHPTVQVLVDSVGLLGILNGLFGIIEVGDNTGMGAIQAIYDNEKLVGFIQVPE